MSVLSLDKSFKVAFYCPALIEFGLVYSLSVVYKMSTCVLVSGAFLVIAIQNRQFSNSCNWTAIINYETKYVIFTKTLKIQREKGEGE